MHACFHKDLCRCNPCALTLLLPSMCAYNLAGGCSAPGVLERWKCTGGVIYVCFCVQLKATNEDLGVMYSTNRSPFCKGLRYGATLELINVSVGIRAQRMDTQTARCAAGAPRPLHSHLCLWRIECNMGSVSHRQ